DGFERRAEHIALCFVDAEFIERIRVIILVGLVKDRVAGTPNERQTVGNFDVRACNQSIARVVRIELLRDVTRTGRTQRGTICVDAVEETSLIDWSVLRCFLRLSAVRCKLTHISPFTTASISA